MKANLNGYICPVGVSIEDHWILELTPNEMILERPEYEYSGGYAFFTDMVKECIDFDVLDYYDTVEEFLSDRTPLIEDGLYELRTDDSVEELTFTELCAIIKDSLY